MTAEWSMESKRLEALREAVQYAKQRADDLRGSDPADSTEWEVIADLISTENGMIEGRDLAPRANRPTPANPDNGDVVSDPLVNDLIRAFNAACLTTIEASGEHPAYDGMLAVTRLFYDRLADQLEERANALRDGPFRTGEVGIEYISGYEAAAYHLRTLAEDSKADPVERWPEAETFGFDSRCCRFPKNCSAIYPDDTPDDRLEPA